MQKPNPDPKERLPDRRKPILSEALFADSDEVVIQHRDEQYRLRRTRAGKLILTK